jgi:hypothetical protein
MPIVLSVKYPPGSWFVGAKDLEFGKQHAGSGFSYDLRISNGGRGPLFNVSVGVDGTSFTQTNNCPATLMPPSGCTVHLVLATANVGSASDTLHLVAQGTTYDVGLHATVIALGPYLTVESYPATQQGLLGDRIDSQVRIVAFDSDVTISKIMVDDANGVITNQCVTVTTSGCNFTLSYTPRSVGTRNATVTIESNSSTSPQKITLQFNGIFPLSISPDHLSVSGLVGQMIGTGITLNNLGANYVGQIQSISAMGPLAVNSQCGNSIAAKASCQVIVNATAVSTGMFSGKVTVVTPDATLELPVTGNGLDFTVGPGSGASQTLTLVAGQTASLPLSVAGVAGFASGVNLTCATNIPLASCLVNPTSVQLNSSGTASSAMLNITTTKRGSAETSPVARVFWTFGGLAFGCILTGSGKRRRTGAMMLLCAVCLFGFSSCGGSSGGGGITQPPTQSGTPAGTYTATVTATYSTISPAVTRTMTVTVNVQ